MQQEANPWASHVYIASHSLCEVSVNWKARETVGHALHPSLEIFFAGKVCIVLAKSRSIHLVMFNKF